MADSDDPKAEASAEKAYAAAAEAIGDKDEKDVEPTDSEPATPSAGQPVVEASVAESAEPVEFPAKPKRAAKPAAASDKPTVAAKPAASDKPAAAAKPADEPVAVAPVVTPPAVEAKPSGKAVPAAKTIKPAVKSAVSTPAPAKPAPAKPEPAKIAPAKAAPPPKEPAKAEPVKAEPVKAEPAKAEPSKLPKTAIEKKTAPKAAPTMPAKASTAAAPKLPFIAQLKEIPMDVTASIKEAVNGAQDKAKEAFTKTSAAASEYGEFAKGNVEAVVESGKILATGLQDLGNKFIADSKTAIETATADVKALTSVKSPTELFQFQTDLLRRNFDTAVSYSTKTGEALLKLTGDVIKPLSGRVTLAVEKIKSAA